MESMSHAAFSAVEHGLAQDGKFTGRHKLSKSYTAR